MAQMVIVTKQCYLICESINYIAINEVRDDDQKGSLSAFLKAPSRKTTSTKKKPKSVKTRADYIKHEQLHKITIDFISVPTNTGPNSHRSSDSTSSVEITVRGRDLCLELFKDMVDQIREQMPDALYLNKLVENFLTTTETL